jgi:hypothetical protein
MAENLDLQTLLRPRRHRPAGAPLIAPAPEREAVADAAVRESFDARCEVLRFVDITDETGGSSSFWTQAGSYPCRVSDAGTEREGISEAGAQSEAPYAVHLPPTAQVLADDRLGIPGWFNAWQPQMAYEVGAKVLPTSTRATCFLVAVEAGVSGNVAPDNFPSHEGQTLRDGSVLWSYGGRASFLEVVGSNSAKSNSAELVVRAKEVS